MNFQEQWYKDEKVFRVLNEKGDIEATIFRPSSLITVCGYSPRMVQLMGENKTWSDKRIYNIWELISENEKYTKTLCDIKQHIKDKVRKSLEYDWGISSNRSDRLFTETVVELQLIEHMIDECLDTYGYKNTEEVCEKK